MSKWPETVNVVVWDLTLPPIVHFRLGDELDGDTFPIIQRCRQVGRQSPGLPRLYVPGETTTGPSGVEWLFVHGVRHRMGRRAVACHSWEGWLRDHSFVREKGSM